MTSMFLVSLKKVLKAQRLRSDDVRTTVVQWFQQQPNVFFAEGMNWLTGQWDD
jgi:hypothetical protein